MALTDAVRAVIEELRPIVALDQGDLGLDGVDEATGVVTLAMTGACTGCTSADPGLRAGVERILRDRVPAVTRVVAVPGESCSDGGPT